jgi:hypothetical protein
MQPTYYQKNPPSKAYFPIITPKDIIKKLEKHPNSPFPFFSSSSSYTVNKGVQKYSYNRVMPAERLPQATSLATALRRLELCTYAVQEIHMELDAPQDPESKADLILATEKLVSETVDLYQTVRLYVWGPEPEDEE